MILIDKDGEFRDVIKKQKDFSVPVLEHKQ